VAGPEALAELTAIAGVRTASQLRQSSLDITGSAGGACSGADAGAVAARQRAEAGRRGLVLRSMSLVLALLAEATRVDSWVAIAGMPDLGLLTAVELASAWSCWRWSPIRVRSWPWCFRRWSTVSN
jgi:hypothetical protein